MILGITTAPRPDGAEYLGRTIKSSADSGFSDVIVCSEPGTVYPDFTGACGSGGVQIFPNPEMLGNYGNFKKLAETLLAWSDENEILVTAEDDIEFCSNAAKKIVDAMQPFLAGREQSKDFGFFAAYSASCHQDHLQSHSLAPLKTTSLWGACCLVWTRESLRALLDHKIFKEWRGLDDNRPPVGSPKIKHVDTCISKVMDKLNRKMYFCRPSLVRHVGVVSTLRKKAWTPDRDCHDFAGVKK